MKNLAKSTLLALLILSAVHSPAPAQLIPDELGPPDVFAAVAQLRDDLEMVRAAMDAPREGRALIEVSNTARREVYFQALTLKYRAERLCSERLRSDDIVLVPLIVDPDKVLLAGEVLDLVVKASSQIRCAKWDMEIYEEAEPYEPDASKTLNDVHESLAQANRQLNLLLEEQVRPGDVFTVVQLANSYTTALLDDLAPVWRGSAPTLPPYVEGKRPVDVYQQLAASYKLIEEIAERSGFDVLHFKPELTPGILPSDVFDLAALLVAELRYFSFFTDTTVEFQDRPDAEKVSSDVFQQAVLLDRNLRQLLRLAQVFPNWSAEDSQESADGK